MYNNTSKIVLLEISYWGILCINVQKLSHAETSIRTLKLQKYTDNKSAQIIPDPAKDKL